MTSLGMEGLEESEKRIILYPKTWKSYKFSLNKILTYWLLAGALTYTIKKLAI